MRYKGILCTLLWCVTTHSAQSGEPIWNIAARAKGLSCSIESKLDNLAIADLSGTFTVIDSIIENELTLSSEVNDLQGDLENFDFDGTFTEIEALFKLAGTINSELDIPFSAIETIQENFGTPITNESVGSTGFTITTGGEYYLAENITFFPNSTNLAAITIDADNTFINFRNKTLSTDGTSGTIGVEILTHTNIAIENGAISNTDAQGILANTDCNEILLQRLTIQNVANESGIEFMPTCSGIRLRNLNIHDCNNHGLLIDSSTDFSIEGCTFNNNGDGTGSGLRSTDCSNILITDCFANNNTDSGFQLDSITTASIISCRNNTAAGNGQHGIIFSSINDSNIKQGYSVDNTLDGIHLSDCSRIIVSNNCCESNGRDNIRLATDSSGTTNCYVGQNSLVLTTSVNLREEAGSSQNGVFGNFALANASSNNYVSIGGGSFFNQADISQSGSFPATEPTFWNNISMTT